MVTTAFRHPALLRSKLTSGRNMCVFTHKSAEIVPFRSENVFPIYSLLKQGSPTEKPINVKLSQELGIKSADPILGELQK